MGDRDDEGDFSDVSSVNEAEHAINTPTLINEKGRWLGRAIMKKRWEERERKKEEEKRIRMAAYEKERVEREKREKEAEEAYLARLEAGEETVSDAGSGFSADSTEAAPAISIHAAKTVPIALDGPDLEWTADDKQLMDPPAVPKQNESSASDDFGSDSDSQLEEPPASPKIATRNDDSNRVELQIQGSVDGLGAGPRRVVVRLRGDWCPLGSARFMELVEAGFYHGSRFHRVVKGDLAQFGLPVDPSRYNQWKSKLLQDESDGVKVSNSRGTLSFASRGENTRCCQVFINMSHHKSFDNQGFTPFAEVVSGMDIIDELFSDYGELPPKGTGPDPEMIKVHGLEYLDTFPKLSRIVSAEVLSRSGDYGVGLRKDTSLKKIGVEDGSPKQHKSRVSFTDQLSPEMAAALDDERRSRSPPAGSGIDAVRALKGQPESPARVTA